MFEESNSDQAIVEGSCSVIGVCAGLSEPHPQSTDGFDGECRHMALIKCSICSHLSSALVTVLRTRDHTSNALALAQVASCKTVVIRHLTVVRQVSFAQYSQHSLFFLFFQKKSEKRKKKETFFKKNKKKEKNRKKTNRKQEKKKKKKKKKQRKRENVFKKITKKKEKTQKFKKV